ncbi:hypothetical protein [Nocardioides sp.]|uniref:hypothetical protein n=1 Tax=Nocardioides sp. TaxID=35761 RepID=UPI002EDA36E7
MNPVAVNTATATARVRERPRDEVTRRGSGRVDRAIHAARSARVALLRAEG